MDTLPLYLASNSPRRREILTLAGWTFHTCPADIDETPRSSELPVTYVGRLALRKAHAAMAGLCQNGLKRGVVLAADTTVADEAGQDGPRILGKPADAQEAAAMLRSLRARPHRVYTALAAIEMESGQVQTALSSTEVWMRAYSDAEIAAYVSSGDPLDKAGAYAIQHTGFHPVERIEGCYGGVVGLPLCLLGEILATLGMSLPAGQREIQGACLSSAQRICRVRELLTG